MCSKFMSIKLNFKDKVFNLFKGDPETFGLYERAQSMRS